MHSHSKGFTLIELMIAIAIIGILAAIAVPTYNTYVYKARVSELVSRAAPLQSAVAEFVGTTGAQDLTALPLANFAQFEIGPCTGTTAATTGPSGNIQNLCIQSNGSITVVGTANTAPGTPAKIGLIPTLNADGSLIWACRSCDANTAKYAAANCSEQATCTGP